MPPRRPRRKFGPSQKDRIFLACLPDAETAARIHALAETLKAQHGLEGTLILPEHLPTKLREAAKQNGPAPAADSQTMDEIERAAILAALKQHKSNRTETAKALGISRRALLYKLQRLRQQGFQFE